MVKICKYKIGLNLLKNKYGYSILLNRRIIYTIIGEEKLMNKNNDFLREIFDIEENPADKKIEEAL